MRERFEEHFGRPPKWIARAPGRVNLIGEHTDYNGGYVLPMAIDRHTHIAAALNGTDTVTLRSTSVDDVVEIDLRRPLLPDRKGAWANYPKGVIAGFMELGHGLRGFDALIDTTVPVGSGLSSSAALEVATATLLEAMVGERLDPIKKADLCRMAEHRYAQVPCGIMDQLISTLAREHHLMLLNCATHEIDWIELAEPNISILVIQTNVRHELAKSEYPLRRSECEAAAGLLGVPLLSQATGQQLEAARARLSLVQYRRARHVLTENERTLNAARALRVRDWIGVGQLMYASHKSLAEDFEVSCPELDAVVEIAQNIGPKGGVYGCRMTGGGFGGCAVALIDTAVCESIARTITKEYTEATHIHPALFATRPAAGATLLSGLSS